MPQIRLLIWLLASLAVAAGLTMIWPDRRWLSLGVLLGCVFGMIALILIERRGSSDDDSGSGRADVDDITGVGEERRRELMRGTSMYLRERRYRYSVRIDETNAADRRPFTADVNEVRLGFIPAVLLENATDKQGLGYVAFVHDGRRWRGPGLPCPGPDDAAVSHAAKCVEPIDDFE